MSVAFRRPGRSVSAALALLVLIGIPSMARAQDRLCDPGVESCRNILINHIRAETVGIDVAFWFMEDARYTTELMKRWQAGVPVRVFMDTRANATNQYNADRLAELKAAGIPMRERYTGGILHWKMMLFAGQGVVEFSGANYSADAWVPTGPALTNYTDESIFFTNSTSIVNSFRTRYDDLWLNNSAYRNYANVVEPRTRVYGIFPKDPQLNFPPSENYANRSTSRYNKETQKIDVIMYRITDERHTNAMIAAHARGVPVRLITEPQQYRDIKRLWHSWNVDRLYMAGIPIKQREHAGLNHQKAVLLYSQGLTIFGSSNWSSASADSQEEHNLFSTDSAVFQWFVDQFERKWNNTGGVVENVPFVPLPPDKPVTPTPANLATAIPTASAGTLKWYGGPWAHVYDVYLGTDPANMTLVGGNLELGPSETATQTQKFVVTTPLLPGTTYYWRVVGKTMANMTANSSIWSFTTAGTAPPPLTATIVRQPYLQQVTTTSAAIVWAARESGPAQVRYSVAGATPVTVTAAGTPYTVAQTGLSADYVQYVATLTGLTPATTYQYDILLNNLDMNPALDTFTTAPAATAPHLSFVAFGDSGTGSAGQQQIAAQLSAETFDFAMHAGDIAYGSADGTGGATFQTMDSWFFSPYSSWLRRRPVFPSMGNHDSRAENGNGQPYRGLFVLPETGGSGPFADHAERYYSFNYGQVHVVVLDTELAFQGPDLARRNAQLTWLQSDLAANTRPWKIALFHRSPYSTGGEHGSDLEVRAVFGPIFEHYGVQLAISAHEHDYERTIPIKASSDPGGSPVVYVVTGGGGGPLYPAAVSSTTAAAASVYHYLRGTVDDCVLRLDAINANGVIFDTSTILRCAPPADTVAPVVSVTAPTGAAPLKGNVGVTVAASDNIGVAGVDLLIDGVAVGHDSAAPFTFTWNSLTATNGPHSIAALATDAAGNATTSAPVAVTVDNPSAGAGDIVLYAADATVVVGKWQKQTDVSAAGGALLRNPDAAAAKKAAALANPVDYFELSFYAQAGQPYHLWIRGKGDGNNWQNDSVFVQFAGATAYPIGTTSAAEVNLEECGSCRIENWGWQDNGYGAGEFGPHIVFTVSGPHTIRIQSREDGFSIDQVMLSPVKFLSTAPGPQKNDANIYPRDSGAPPAPDTISPSVTIVSPAQNGAVTGVVTIAVTATDDVGVAAVELRAGDTILATDTTAPFELTWNAGAETNGPRQLKLVARDAAGNAGAATLELVVDNPPPPAPDTESPVVAFTAPAAAATVQGAVPVTVDASDNVGVLSVELRVDGAAIGTDSSAPFAFTWNAGTAANGPHQLGATAVDAAGNSTSVTVDVVVDNPPPPPPDTEMPVVSIASPVDGATVSGTVAVMVDATDNVAVTSVELRVDGALIGTDAAGPFEITWNTSAATNGGHTLEVKAIDAAGNAATSSVGVIVDNPVVAVPADIVLYAADATVIAGKWKKQADATAAGGEVIRHPDGGAAKRTVALASPADYFELTFAPLPNVPYHLWIRGKGDADSWQNDSVFVQFSANAAYPIGTALAAEVNLEACGSCGIAKWGWQDNGYGANVFGPNIVFSSGGMQTIRIQTREDGYAIDQVMLSPTNFVTTPPGALKNDTTIYPSNVGAPPPPDTTAPAVAIASPSAGATVTGPVSIVVTATDNVGVASVELRDAATLIGSDTTAPFEFSWNASLEANGPRDLVATATDAAGNASSVTLHLVVDNPPPPPPDVEPPAVTIASPAADAIVVGSTGIQVDATDNVGVVSVEVRVDGVSIGSDSTAPFEVSWNAAGATNGPHELQAVAVDAAGLSSSATVAVVVDNPPPPPPDTEAPVVSIASPVEGATLSGTVAVLVEATDNVAVTAVELRVDGALTGSDTTAPFELTWNTAGSANGSHTIEVKALDAAGNSATASVGVTIDNPVLPTTIVLYAAQAAVVVGKWQVQADATAAGGALLRNPNADAAKRTVALAAPVDYFEMTFSANAGVPYHLWVRGKAASNYWQNDSVFVQFSDTATLGIGTTAAAEVNLEDCGSCGVTGWGWQDNGYGAGVLGPNITFTTSGLHTIRVQVREDGFSIDQIVLSPSTYLTAAPGPLKNDATILPK